MARKTIEGNGWQIFALLFISIIEVITIFFLIYCLPNLPSEQETLRLPLMVLFGVIAFLGALTIAASVLNFFKLSNPLEALGLPPGSVRALIALSLILIFSLMVIFMANNLATPKVFTYSGNSTIIYGDKVYNATAENNQIITILVPASEAAVDFSKQVLTTVSTLVVALAGFYFGTRSVAQAQQSKEPEVSITLNPEDDVVYKLTGTDDKVKIIVTTKPEKELIDFEIINDKKDGTLGVINRTQKPNEFEYIPPTVKEDTKVTLRFYMAKYPSDREELRITVQPK